MLLTTYLKTYNKGPKAGANGSNGELRKEIFFTVYTKALLLKLRWMPFQLKEKEGPPPDDISIFDITANVIADTYAGQAAPRLRIPDEATASCLYHAKLIQKINRILSCILMNLPSRKVAKDNSFDSEKNPKVTLDQLLHDTNHNSRTEVGRVTCIVCSNSFAKRDPALKDWLKTLCIKLQGDPVAPHIAPTQHDTTP